MLYALINPDNQIDKTHDFIDNDIPNTKEDWKWIPVESQPRPAYDPELQDVYIEETIQLDKVIRVWIIRDKPQDQIDAEKMAKVDSIDDVTIKALLQLYNTVNSPITLDEYKLVLRGLI